MNPVLRALALAATLFVVASTATAQPRIGQPGKDVIWLPAELVMVEKMLDLARVTAADTVMDLGSGDGRTVVHAALRGARAIGVEFDAELVAHARTLARREGVGDRVVFEQGDLFAADLSRATVITLFLLPSINLKLRPKLLSLRPGTRVVSNTFTMDQWQSDEATRAEPETGCSLYCVAYLWIVPAAVGGRWKHPAGELVFLQRFQTVTGILGGAPLIGRLRGEDIVFSADGIEYRGRLVSGDSRGNTTRNMPGDALEGTFSSGAGTGRWRAERVK